MLAFLIISIIVILDITVIFGDEDNMHNDQNTGKRTSGNYTFTSYDDTQFPDYSTEELYEIAEIQAQKNGMRLESDVEETLVPMLEEVSEEKNFGNGGL